MESQFAGLVEELGTILGLKLHPDHLNVCRLKYPDGLEVQIEVDRDEIRLLIGSRIGILPPGRFRQDFLEQTLKANTTDFRLGTFGYAKKSGELYLYAYLLMKNLTAKQVADFLAPFTEKARLWSSSLTANRVPILEPAGPKKASGMFGLAS